MLGAAHQSNPEYAEAQAKISDFQKRSDEAFQKAKAMQNNPVAAANSNSATSVSYSNNYSPTPAAATNPTAASTPQKVARQPAPRGERPYLVFSSSGGDYIGQGKDWTFTSNDSKFTVNSTKRYVNLSVSGQTWYHLRLSVPENLSFQTGAAYHTNGSRSSQNSVYPTMDFGGDGRGCTAGEASFTIDNIQFNEFSGELLYIDVSFRQRCQNTSANLLGRWRYDVR